MGYHTREFEKGVYGEFSKIQEEWEELLDARLQDGKVLELCELADLYGAIEGYVKKRFNMTMEDIAKMSEMTKTAFLEGKRTSSNDTRPVARCQCKGASQCQTCSEEWLSMAKNVIDGTIR